MSCGFSKDLLALHVEGDLSQTRAEETSNHLRTCEDCRRFLDELGATQSLLKLLRSETIRPADCTPMRRNVMSIIEDRREGFGWMLRVERAIMLGFGVRSYAFAAVALLGIVSVSVMAQMRQTTPAMRASEAVFERGNALLPVRLWAPTSDEMTWSFTVRFCTVGCSWYCRCAFLRTSIKTKAKIQRM